jgi:hypothetical protein
MQNQKKNRVDSGIIGAKYTFRGEFPSFRGEWG